MKNLRIYVKITKAYPTVEYVLDGKALENYGDLTNAQQAKLNEHYAAITSKHVLSVEDLNEDFTTDKDDVASWLGFSDWQDLIESNEDFGGGPFNKYGEKMNYQFIVADGNAAASRGGEKDNFIKFVLDVKNDQEALFTAYIILQAMDNYMRPDPNMTYTMADAKALVPEIEKEYGGPLDLKATASASTILRKLNQLEGIDGGSPFTVLLQGAGEALIDNRE